MKIGDFEPYARIITLRHAQGDGVIIHDAAGRPVQPARVGAESGRESLSDLRSISMTLCRKNS